MEVQGINQAINITISLTDATSGINGDMTVVSPFTASSIAWTKWLD